MSVNRWDEKLRPTRRAIQELNDKRLPDLGELKNIVHDSKWILQSGIQIREEDAQRYADFGKKMDQIRALVREAGNDLACANEKMRDGLSEEDSKEYFSRMEILKY